MEGDAGEIGQLNPTDADGSSGESGEVVTEAPAEEVLSGAGSASATSPAESPAESPVESTRPPSRIGRAWLAAITVVLLVLSAGVALGGYLALRAHSDSRADARAEAVALQAAKDCVGASYAPDAAAMAASQRKIIECATGDFAVQATVYGGMLVEAYQAANAQVKVSDMRAAVERHNDDGSIEVLVAMRVKVTNSDAADQEASYRLRAKMAPDGAAYKIARLDQVAH
jgi:Mce-associated membrane protein